jgi:modulator of FtsH protease HflC
MPKSKLMQHWPILVMVVVVAAIFLIALMAFQVQTTEHAVLKRFGQPVKVNGEFSVSPGLHIRLPFIHDVWRQDNRLQFFEGTKGAIEEVLTKDEKTIIVNVYVSWKIAGESDSVVLFMNSVNNLENAKEKLTSMMRDHKKSVIGQYDFRDLVNQDANAVKIQKVEAEILAAIQQDAKDKFGIEVQGLGIKHIGFPKSVATSVFESMKKERQKKIEEIVSEGERMSIEIMAEAKRKESDILSKASSDAKKIRGEGDAKAAKSYAVFQDNPDLAIFLRKLEALKLTLKDNATVILSTNQAPFDLLDEDAITKEIKTVKESTK